MRSLSPTTLALIGLAAAGLAASAFHLGRARPPEVGGPAPSRALSFAPIAPPSTAALVGDPRLGFELYRVHCVSCHGFDAAGDGPANAYLHPSARDHTSAYMGTRSDEQLFNVIDRGGGPNALSSLMPAFSDRFDEGETWAIIAYLRTLHPELGGLVPEAKRFQLEPVILSEERLKLAGGGRRVDVVAAYSEATGSPRRLAHVLVEPIPDAPARLWVATVRDDRGAVSRRVVPDGRIVSETARPVSDLFGMALGPDVRALAAAMLPPEAAALASRIRASAERAEARLLAALSQREVDLREANEVAAAFKTRASTLPRGQQLFLRNCATCHGVTAKVVGPNLIAFPLVRPRDLSDGETLNVLTDEHLTDVIRRGGGPNRLSNEMPAFGPGTLTDEEVRELVAFVRTLATPPYTPRIAHARTP